MFAYFDKTFLNMQLYVREMTCLCGAKELSFLCTLGTDSSNSSLSKNSSASSNDSVIYRPNGADTNTDSCTNSPVSLLRLPKVINLSYIENNMELCPQ